MPSKKSLLVGAAVSAVTLASLGTVGVVSAATPSSASGGTSIVDKIATKFNLNKDDVKAVFDEDRAAREAEHKAEQADRLAEAVKDGKLTQEQADYITNAQTEIESLRGSATPDTQSDETRTQVRSKMDALRTWAQENNIDAKYLGGHGGPGGFDGPRGERPTGTNSSSTNSNS